MCMRVTYHSSLVGAASVLALLFLRRARLVGRAWWGGPSAGFFLTARRRTRRACLWRHPPRAASSAPPAAAPHARPAAPLGTALACLLRFASTAPVGPAAVPDGLGIEVAGPVLIKTFVKGGCGDFFSKRDGVVDALAVTSSGAELLPLALTPVSPAASQAPT